MSKLRGRLQSKKNQSRRSWPIDGCQFFLQLCAVSFNFSNLLRPTQITEQVINKIACCVTSRAKVNEGTFPVEWRQYIHASGGRIRNVEKRFQVRIRRRERTTFKKIAMTPEPQLASAKRDECEQKHGPANVVARGEKPAAIVDLSNCRS
jgi:hypothetical protein